MSILDSQTEIDAARERLHSRTDESLVTDLTYWNVAAADAADDYRAIAEKEATVRRLHAEAQQWVGLVTAEIRSRRPSIREVSEP